MSFLSWKNVKMFYEQHCKTNREFLQNLHKIPLTSYDDDAIVHDTGTITNTDIIESKDQINELTELLKKNKLITSRMGCVETAFMIKHLFNLDILTHLRRENDIDYNMRANAGLYYKNSKRRKEILDWWCNHTKELIVDETISSCYCVLNFDFVLWAALNIKKQYYNYGCIAKIILQNSENKKILYIGSGVDSIRAGYERGVQSAWNFPVSNFDMYYVKTPVTTIGCDYPHDSIKETCEAIINEIDDNYSDFDTAVLGCGAYGPPIINMLRKKYDNKNMCYLGAECYKMFGIYSKGMPYTNYNEANKENWLEVVEKNPTNGNHPEPKYWK